MQPGDDLIDVTKLLIRRRRSCRTMVPGKIPHNVMTSILDAGVWAPTGSNHQNVRFLVLDGHERMKELGRWKAPKSVISKASAGIVVLTDDSIQVPEDERHIWDQLWLYNAGAAIQNMLLMATAAGLGSCWISLFGQMSGTRLTSGRHWRELFPEYEIPGAHAVHGIVLLGPTVDLDAEGFPKGDARHGGRPVARPPFHEFVLPPKK